MQNAIWSRKSFYALAVLVILFSISTIWFLKSASASGTPISLTTPNVAYTQDFNTLASTGTSSTVPTGWAFSESGTNANTTYTAGTGSGTAGDTYSFGASGSSERAFGGLQSSTLVPTIGACFTNNTGVTITSLGVAYTGEQWRLGATGRADRIDFQYSTDATSLTTGIWIDVNALDFSSPITTGTTGALDGNASANRTAISNTITGLNIPVGATFFIRWTDFNATGSDDGLSVDDFSLTPNPVGPVTPNLSINDVSLAEGNSGTITFTFTVTLSSPALAGGVTFDIATADGTATMADNDYVGQSLPGQTIAQGNTTYMFNVTVNGDTTTEPNETFFVNVTNVTGANVTDGQGLGTINNDDVTLTPIHTIQGSGNVSPFAGSSLTTSGIVTGRKSNGFFIQEPDATIDADPNTSEGVFIFTSSAPPAAAAVGNGVQVIGTVQEFLPSGEPNDDRIKTTEIISPTVVQLSSGNPLPAPIVLTTADMPGNNLANLEKYEGMRVQVNSLTVVAPTSGTVNEANATSSSNGVFYGVITGIARPFREPGIQIPDPLPAGTPANVPRFDANPEKLRIDSDGQPGAATLDVVAGQVVLNLVGPLDYGFRHYTILPDPPPSPAPTVTGNNTFVAVPDRAANEFTIASFNMERFFDTTDDPSTSDVVLTTTAFNNRLNKASLAIRNVMKTPDILGVEEMENLTTLQAVANKVNTDFGDTSVVNYVAYLFEGNDVGGIDVGFLVNSARVTSVTVTQFNLNETYINPNNGQPELLNDRPPLVLIGTISASGYVPTDVTVIVNHLRSLSGIDDPTDGNRIRTKRQKQAESLANLIQARQTANPNEKIIAIGDLNAFQFNDGYVDTVGTIRGVPTPADQVTLASADLVDPDLVDLVEQATATERYSFNFDGSAQVLDHELANDDMFAIFSRIAYARNNSDFPEVFRSNANRPERISDHDMPVAYFQLQTPTAAKLSAFEALSQGDEVLLQWRTGEEVNNLGFNLYKEERGIRRRLTPQIVAGSALVAGAETSLAAGRSYSWWDNFTDVGAQYWLEEIDLNGNSVWHGPVHIKSAERISGSKQRQATLLNVMGREQLQDGATLPVEIKAEPSGAMLSGNGAYEAATIQPAVDVAGRAAIKIAVKRAGMYRLTQSELLATGLSPSAHAQKLQLFVDGREVPISISGKSAGQIDSSTSIEFYGIGLDSPVTEARTYWLIWDDAEGKRIQKAKGDGKPTIALSYPYTVERRDRTLYFAALKNGDKENFFGAVISRTPVDQALTLQHLDAKAPQQATVEVALQGVSQLAHRVNVSVNGVVLGEVKFDKQELGVTRFTIAPSQLREGTNQVTLTSQNGDSDVSLVDYIRITYNHTFTADGDALTLTATGKEQVSVGGFSNNAIRTFDVTNANEPVELAATVTQQKTGYAVTFAPSNDGNRNVVLTTTGMIRRPANIVANQPSALRSASNSADWMIITHSSLFEAAKQLQAYRQSQGLQAKLVDIDDVYDEFAFGNKAPQAIRSFLAYAAQNWQRAPRYIVLMGDSTFDPKNYLGRGDFDLVPTKLIDSSFLETASDDWFANAITNTGTRMMIGRLPVRGSDEAARMVVKIINYEQTPKADSVLLVSDVSDTFNFAAASHRLREIITDGSQIEVIDRGTTDGTTARRALLDAIKRGQKVINYTGHGSVDMWRGNLLTATDARGLTNQEHLPLFVMMNCLNGYFQDTATDSLAEALMKAERGGAVAVWASSGLTVPGEQSLMNQQMFRLLFSDDAARAKAMTLGDVTSRAKATVGDADVRATWILFGDPATRLR